jgi:hypothetical protein
LAFALSFTAAPAAAAPNASQFCTANGDFGVTHGECTSFFAGGNSLAVTNCKFIRDNFPAIFDANWKNLGDCVSFMRHL